jgi:electron transfer flavoprotein beta subunit
MKIITTIKRVTDYEARLKILPDNLFIDTNDVNMITNPFDEIGVEASLQIKEDLGGEVIVVSIGEEETQQNIRTALAMGADRGILILRSSKEQFINTSSVADILNKVVQQENPDLVIMGKQSIDTDNHQTAEYLAEIMGVGNASQANKITIKDGKAIVIKEADGGLETIELDMPCVISTDLRLNQPRYPSLPGIMKAKRKPLKKINIEDLGVEPNTSLINILNVREQSKREAGIILKNIDDLLNHIKIKDNN